MSNSETMRLNARFESAGPMLGSVSTMIVAPCGANSSTICSNGTLFVKCSSISQSIRGEVASTMTVPDEKIAWKSGLLRVAVGSSTLNSTPSTWRVRATVSSKKALGHLALRSRYRRLRHTSGSCERLKLRNCLAAWARGRVERCNHWNIDSPRLDQVSSVTLGAGNQTCPSL